MNKLFENNLQIVNINFLIYNLINSKVHGDENLSPLFANQPKFSPNQKKVGVIKKEHNMLIFSNLIVKIQI